MGKRFSIGRMIGVAAVLSFSCLVVRAATGEIVNVSSAYLGGPTIKVRTLQRNPWTLLGFFGVGDVIYRGEYYPDPKSKMSESISFSADSLFAGNRIDVSWSDGNRAEVKMDGDAIFYWTGRAWEEWQAKD